jgi:CspA family cold shock protein
MTGIVKSFDSLSGKGLITLQMVEKTFFFTFQPLTPENQNYSFPRIRIEFCRINGLCGPWLQTSIFPETTSSLLWYPTIGEMIWEEKLND